MFLGPNDSDLQAEFDSLRPGESTEAGATRRTALKAALGVGYAAAALPVAAQTAIKTSSEGLTAGADHVQGQRLQGAGLRGRAGRQDRPAGGAGGPGDLRRARVHRRHLPPLRASSATWPSRPSCMRARAIRRGYTDIPKLQAEVVSQGARRAGDGRPRRRAAAWAAANGGDCAKRRHHRLLLGRPHHLAVRGARGKVKAGVAWYGRLVGHAQRADAAAPGRHRRQPQGAGAGPVRRQGPGHPA